MNESTLRVMKAIFALSDEIEYNIYESNDIADYANMDRDEAAQIIKALHEDGYLGECMTYNDDGFETFYLNRKGRMLIGME